MLTGPIRRLTGPDTHLRVGNSPPGSPGLLGELNGRHLSKKVAGGLPAQPLECRLPMESFAHDGQDSPSAALKQTIPDLDNGELLSACALPASAGCWYGISSRPEKERF